MKEKEIGERIERIVPKINTKKREASSRPVNWIGIGSAVINIQTNTGFVYLYEYIYHSLGLINLFIF